MNKAWAKQTILATLIATAFGTTQAAPLPTLDSGTGSFATTPPAAITLPPATPFVVAGGSDRPLPTNDWWTSVLSERFSERMFPHPLSAWFKSTGLEIAYPKRVVAPQDFGEADILTPHIADLTIGGTGFVPQDARAVDWGDFSVRVRMDSGVGSHIDATLTHGSPYIFLDTQGTTPSVDLASTPAVWAGGDGQTVLGFTVAGRHYGLFAAPGNTWHSDGANRFVGSGAGRYSLAVLPDNQLATLQKFATHADAHIVGTRVDWQYDQAAGQVVTRFSVTTDNPSDGKTILGLYPHQWHHAQNAAWLGSSLDSIRGEMKLVEGNGFTTTMAYHGILPWLPDLGVDNPNLRSSLLSETSAEPDLTGATWDSYWGGKYALRLANLGTLAAQEGDNALRARLDGETRTLVQDWLKADPGESSGLFYYEPVWGTLIGSVPSYGIDSDLNDHHFHYGYWVMAAARIALDDPSWASNATWKPMVDLLIRDFADADRSDPSFPFLRNFDPYAGHSWAAGLARFADGNNQESSSEAVHAWAALILWAEATGNTQLRDLGIWLYTTETEAVRDYWLNVHGDVFDPRYPSSEASMIWSGKYVHTTWWTDDPIQVHGINMLPLGGHSFYLGRDCSQVERGFQAMQNEYALRGSSPQIWQDIMAGTLAMADPAAAESFWNPSMPAEAGTANVWTYQWIETLKRLGRPDPEVTADTPLYSVFARDGQRAYVAYNAGNQAITVHYSDGHIQTVAPRSMAVDQAAVAGAGTSCGGTPATGTGSGTPSETPIPTPTPTPTPAPTDTTVPGGAITETGANSLRFSLAANSAWADVHYRINQGPEQNLRMKAGAGGFTLDVSGLAAGNRVDYRFTWESAGLAVDGAIAQYTFGGNGTQPQPSPTPGTSGFTPSVEELSAGNVRVHLAAGSSTWADVHYTVNGGGQQNFRMQGGNGSFSQDIQALPSGGRLDYWFTYEAEGLARDSAAYQYTVGSGQGSTTTPPAETIDNGALFQLQGNDLLVTLPSNAQWADIHYLRPGMSQQNLRMQPIAGGFSYRIAGVNPGETAQIWFTVEDSGLAHDLPATSWTR